MAEGVAQIFNLLYRRIAFGRAPGGSGLPRFVERFAECNSAIQQNTILRYGSLVWLTFLVITLATGCATQRYDVRLTNGMVIRAVSKPQLNKDGFYFVKEESGKSGTINKVLVRDIVLVEAKKSPSDAESFKSSASSKSAKPSGKPNFRDSFEFR